jgi:hypothetical protein
MQFDSVDFVVGSKVTSDALRSNCHDVTEFGRVIIACHNLFSSYFTDSRVEFRLTNLAAHVLASEATLSTNSTIYYDDPIVLDTIIINEMLSASF